MCGICCVIETESDIHKDTGICCNNSRLANRGPDLQSSLDARLSRDVVASFTGHVLHLRGDQPAEQPASDEHGNILLWNGEIFQGINVPENKSDTSVLLEKLGELSTDEEILTELSKIQGPWAFIYWKESSKSLWFGRDVFGRRSLLWHLPDCYHGNHDVFALSSVRIKPLEFDEVQSVGVYKMTLSDSDPHLYDITMFPWQHAVWPGTLDCVRGTDSFVDRLLRGETRPANMTFTIHPTLEVPSQMPALNKDLPPSGYTIRQLPPDQLHGEYLQTVLAEDPFLRALSEQLANVLLEAVKTRVLNQPKHKLPVSQKENMPLCNGASHNTVDEEIGAASCYPACFSQSHDSPLTSAARVAILFSGGIDSTVIAALADKCVPADEPIDLINVAFEQKPKAPAQPKKKRPQELPDSEKWTVPDRLTGYTALGELNPARQWNFIEVNVTAGELQQERQSAIEGLVYPLQTVLDDSIGCAVWFAARGRGTLGNGPQTGRHIISDARVILCGMGADEQLVGYSRHRSKYKEGGWAGLTEEIELEVTRISARNLGRDDRIITDHGKESRFPFLDERVVAFLSGLPLHHKANLELPRGLGEKLLLRLAATSLGLHQTASLAKRAIQFGSRIAKMENSKEKASDKCDRLAQLGT